MMKKAEINTLVNTQITESIKVKRNILENNQLTGLIAGIADAAVKVYQKGHKLLIAGNGGSAADAQHITGEMVCRFRFDRPALPTVALSTDTSVLTSIGNDYGYDQVFVRQVQALGKNGDMFIGISTSGNSVNILLALEECRKKGIITVGLTGRSGGKMAHLCDYCVQVPSDETPRIQESHIMIGHIICSIVEETMFGGKKTRKDAKEDG